MYIERISLDNSILFIYFSLLASNDIIYRI